jgi:hypothetical protein
MIVLADQVGSDVFGIEEHHRSEFVDSAPPVVLGAAATRNKKIRLTSAVTVLSAADSVRISQEFATLILISLGRAEIVAGRGSSIEAFPLFGFDLDDYVSLRRCRNIRNDHRGRNGSIVFLIERVNLFGHRMRVLSKVANILAKTFLDGPAPGRHVETSSSFRRQDPTKGDHTRRALDFLGARSRGRRAEPEWRNGAQNRGCRRPVTDG